MIDFTTLQGLTIPEGVVTQITDENGRVIWAVSGGKVILEVEKIVSNTYAAETTYENEEFILLDIYPKTNGTVSVTYGGLTKTITDTSGVEEPNAQQVFFGTFNGISDSVSTAASGELTIEGDCVAFGCGQFQNGSKAYNIEFGKCITDVIKWGEVSNIPRSAFVKCDELKTISIGASVTTIGAVAFGQCTGLTSVTIPKSVVDIDVNPFASCLNLTNIIVESGNDYFVIDGAVLFTKDKARLISAVAVTGHYTIPATVTSIDQSAFSEKITSVTVLATTPPILSLAVFGGSDAPYVQSITVPKGCGEAYKAAEGWSNYADLIVEAS